MKSSHPRFSIVAAWMCLALVLAGTGCGSLSGPGSASFASVTIENHSPDQIAAATVQVFTADGYRGRPGAGGQMMVFEKEASRATTLSREGLVGTYYGAATINRVKVQIYPLQAGVWRLQCNAYMVTGGSDPFFQDEVPLTNIRGAPYQLLLNKVEKQLKTASGDAASPPPPATTQRP